MIKQLNPRYQLPHKDYFSCDAIPALYAEVYDQMEKKLALAPSLQEWGLDETR